MITVQLLGGACLRSGDELLAGPPAQRHRIALLTLIVAASPQPISRDRAMTLLWPERDTASARRLLNLAVHVLRAALGDDAIASTGDGLLFAPARVRCDVHDFRVAIGEEAHERVVRLYTGPLLDGFHLDDSTEFSYWLDERRAEIDHAYVGALIALADEQQRSGDARGRVSTCRRLVAVDPHSGAYARSLMHALADAGDSAGAAQHAIEHANRLRADLDLEPDPEVVALAERLRVAETRRRKTTDSADRASPSVAVLPFRNLSTDPENEYFADGITEDVIAHLSKIRALTVISRASVMRFKDRLHDLKSIGTTLGAAAVLDGSVRRAGDRVRIVAQLVDPQTDRHLWSETFDRRMTDIFAIQTEVALQIASALEAELTADERTRVRKTPTRDVQAYHLYLRGREWYIKYTVESAAHAIDYFERAIARDPDFALAYASLAMAVIDLAELGALPPDVAYRRADDAVTTALRLDPDLAEAHCTMGYLEAVHQFDWDGAEREFRTALELKPSDADALDLYGRMCSALMRDDEAIALLMRAQELDPLAHGVDVVTALLRAGRVEEAVPRAEQAVEVNPGDRSHATLGWAYFLSGRKDEGIAQLERAASEPSASTMWLGQLGEAYGLAGKKAKARAVLRTLEERAKSAYVSPYHLAYVHTGLGDAERALDLLERAVAERTGPAYSIKGSFLFAPLRRHPRFEAILRQMKLE
ncbi:MAG TPA: BTAD domain-containing putative transcriptional regulator [Gemmatimonadaceae bacterium]|jgi:serine/threonine-protein kinase|nr:BTAD domain-containing putative transcriptional regulator [Gemmatimonadaceae bacterium]